MEDFEFLKRLNEVCGRTIAEMQEELGGAAPGDPRMVDTWLAREGFDRDDYMASVQSMVMHIAETRNPLIALAMSDACSLAALMFMVGWEMQKVEHFKKEFDGA